MDILPFPILPNTHSRPIQTSIWTFDVEGQVFSVLVDHWPPQDAPEGAYPLRCTIGLQITAKLIDWSSGASYGPRELAQEPASQAHEPHPKEDPVA
jgi:hypothetical protein